MARIGRKRLAVDIPIVLHKLLKGISKNRNCTITKLVIRALIKSLAEHNRS